MKNIKDVEVVQKEPTSRSRPNSRSSKRKRHISSKFVDSMDDEDVVSAGEGEVFIDYSDDGKIIKEEEDTDSEESDSDSESVSISVSESESESKEESEEEEEEEPRPTKRSRTSQSESPSPSTSPSPSPSPFKIITIGEPLKAADLRPPRIPPPIPKLSFHSTILPNTRTEWTTEEKDCLYAALNRTPRFDFEALSVALRGSKSPKQVQEYLLFLERGLKKVVLQRELEGKKGDFWSKTHGAKEMSELEIWREEKRAQGWIEKENQRRKGIIDDDDGEDDFEFDDDDEEKDHTPLTIKGHIARFKKLSLFNIPQFLHLSNQLFTHSQETSFPASYFLKLHDTIKRYIKTLLLVSQSLLNDPSKDSISRQHIYAANYMIVARCRKGRGRGMGEVRQWKLEKIKGLVENLGVELGGSLKELLEEDNEGIQVEEKEPEPKDKVAVQEEDTDEDEEDDEEDEEVEQDFVIRDTNANTNSGTDRYTQLQTYFETMDTYIQLKKNGEFEGVDGEDEVYTQGQPDNNYDSDDEEEDDEIHAQILIPQ